MQAGAPVVETLLSLLGANSSLHQVMDPVESPSVAEAHQILLTKEIFMCTIHTCIRSLHLRKLSSFQRGEVAA